MSILSNKKRYSSIYCYDADKNSLFLQYDRICLSKAIHKKATHQKRDLTALTVGSGQRNNVIWWLAASSVWQGPPCRQDPPNLSKGYEASRAPHRTTSLGRQERSRAGSVPYTRRARPRSPSRPLKTPAAPEVLHIIHSFLHGALRSFRRIGINRPGSHPIHRRTATLIYGQIGMTREGALFPEHLLLQTLSAVSRVSGPFLALT